MRFTLDIPEAEYKRYAQYYKPYIVSMEHDTVENERASPDLKGAEGNETK
jgi:hypothetical protein